MSELSHAELASAEGGGWILALGIVAVGVAAYLAYDAGYVSGSQDCGCP